MILKLAKRSFLKHDPVEPCDEMNFELVHCVSKTRNEEPLLDDKFGIQVEDSYRLRRLVEMYQWYEIEHRHEVDHGNGRKSVHYTYSYHKGWKDSRIDSRKFKQAHHNDNPTNTWPFNGEQWSAKRLDMGNMRLDLDLALDKLGKKNKKEVAMDNWAFIACATTEEAFK